MVCKSTFFLFVVLGSNIFSVSFSFGESQCDDKVLRSLKNYSKLHAGSYKTCPFKNCKGLFVSQNLFNKSVHALIKVNGKEKVLSYVFSKKGERLKFVRETSLRRKNNFSKNFHVFDPLVWGRSVCDRIKPKKNTQGNVPSKSNQKFMKESTSPSFNKYRRQQLAKGWSPFWNRYRHSPQSRTSHVGIQKEGLRGNIYRIGPSWEPAEGAPDNHGMMFSIEKEF